VESAGVHDAVQKGRDGEFRHLERENPEGEIDVVNQQDFCQEIRPTLFCDGRSMLAESEDDIEVVITV
jgi:hypothetical protein